jgi:hypothetical protein
MSTKISKTKTRKNKTYKVSKVSKHNYVVAIPSYGRHETIVAKTLETLKKGGVPAKCVHIFVANETERSAYADAVGSAIASSVPSNTFSVPYKIIVGVKGITEQRKFITRYFAEGTHIVSMDDDVEKFLRLSRDGQKLVEFKKGDLDRFIRKAFAAIEAHNLFLWGVYPMRYAYFMKHNVTTDLRLILGTAYGYICRHDADLVPTVNEKEDYENTIRHYLKDGGVMRFNDICLKTIYHSPGGLGKLTEERLQANKVAAEAIKKAYPDLVTIFKRPNGMTEVRLL